MIPDAPSAANRSRVTSAWAGPGARLVLLLAAGAILYGRVLAPGTLPYAHDTLAHDFPIHLWAWSEVARTGEMPLWFPHLQNGLPTFGSFAWCPFYPTDWLMAVSVAGGFRLQWCLALVIAGLGMVAWGRAAGLGVGGRWTAAVALALSGHLVTLISPGHLQKAQAIAWLPWAMAAVEWALNGAREKPPSGARRLPPSWWTRAILGGMATGAALGVQLLASHTQIAYLTALLVGWRAVWLTVGALAGCPRTSRGGILAGLVLWGLALPVGATLLGGAELLPGVETAHLSNRAEGVSYDEAVLTSYPPVELLEYAFPRFLGDSVRDGWNSYLGDWGERLVTDYAGGGTILLVLIALGTGRRRAGLRVWLALTVAGALVLALGRHTPAYRWAYEYLPGFNRFRSPGTQMVIAAWAIAALAGVGVCAVREAMAHDVTGARRWFLGLATVAVLFPLGALVVGHQASTAMETSGLTVAEDVGRVLRHKAILLSSVAGTCFWTGLFAGGLLGALAIEWRWRWPALLSGESRGAASPVGVLSPWHPARWVLLIPVGILAVDLLTRLQPFLSPENEEPYRAYLFQSPGDVRIAQDPRLPRRLIERGNELTLRPILNGIDVPMGYHPVTYRWMQETMESLGLESAALREVWAVNYVRVPGPERPDRATSWTAVLETPSWTLWRDDHPPPFARFPSTVISGEVRRDLPKLFQRDELARDRPALVEPGDAAQVRAWLEDLRDEWTWKRRLPAPRLMDEGTTSSQASRSPMVPDHVPVGQRPGNPQAVVVEQGADDWVLRIGSDGPRWLVLSTVPAPGWTSTKLQEGQEDLPVPIFRADGSSSLIPWPGGTGFLVLLYRPWSVRFGMFLTLLGVMGFAIAAGWRIARVWTFRK